MAGQGSSQDRLASESSKADGLPGIPKRRFDGASPGPGVAMPRTASPYPRQQSSEGVQEPAHLASRADCWTRMMVTVIAAILALGLLYVASDLFVPVVIVALAYLSLRPIEAKLCQWGISQTIASGLLIFGLFSALGLIVAMLYSPAQQWIVAAPESLAEVRGKLESIAEPLTTLDRAETTVDEATAPLDDGEPTIEVAYEKPSMVDETILINQTGKMLAFIVAIAVMTFFMLSTGDDLLNRMLGILPTPEAREDLLNKIGDIQHSVGHYLAQILSTMATAGGEESLKSILAHRSCKAVPRKS